MQKIFLVGYMGAGKTTIGRNLAQKLNMHFVDLDLFIENRYRKKIREIFEEKGEKGFRQIERNALLEIISFENALVSTGGGTPCFFDNMSLMNESGLTIYLKVSVEELANRLDACKQTRPLIKDKTKEELISFIQENLQLREPFYDQSVVKIDSCSLDTIQNVDSTVHQISNYLKKMEDYESKES
ncbi:MAG: shikimate kinase [Bacteroidales bacterium]|nr:shikimate kinase [Bacteroidales bacterium]